VTALVWSLVAALGWGVSDFVGGLAARRASAVATVLLAFPVGAIGLLALAPFVGGQVGGLVVGAVCGVLSGFGVLWFYAALAAGPMSVVSPLTALLVAGLPLLAGVFLGERPGLLALLGAALGLVAVVLVSWSERTPVTEDRPVRLTARALWMTVGAGVAYAAFFVVLDFAPADSGVWPLVASRVVASVMVVIACLPRGGLRLLRTVPLRLALAAGLLDVVANVAFLYALRSGLLSLVSVLTALYPAATVVLARAVLGERTGPVQQVGLGVAVAAVTLIAVGA
jgi:drug/metabolite transporter (DMT)-like permease